MSHLPGNPHYAWAADTLESLEQAEGTYLSPDEHALQTANAFATLALAHEQRTANLIALWAIPEELASSLASASGVGNDGVQKDIYAGVAQQILGRLGL